MGGGIELLDAPDGPGAYVRLFLRVEGGAAAHIAPAGAGARNDGNDQQKAKT